VPGPEGNRHPILSPFGIFPAADGSLGAEAFRVSGIFHTGSQSFDGHHRTKGLSAFMRNSNSVLARKLNTFYGTRGHFWRETYRSTNIHSVLELLRSLIYYHSQHEHHRSGQSTRQAGFSSLDFYLDHQPDGVVDRFPTLPGWQRYSPVQRSQLLRQLIRQAQLIALEAERRPGVRPEDQTQIWRDATRTETWLNGE